MKKVALICAALVASASAAQAAPKHKKVAARAPAAATVTITDPLASLQGKIASLFSQINGTTTNVIGVIKTFTVADLQAALADAQTFKISTSGVLYAVDEQIVLPDQVTTLEVTSVLNGAITGVKTVVAGPIALGNSAPGPIAQLSSTGKGTGASFVVNDVTAANCYTALIPIVQSNLDNPLPSGVGGFQLLQKARDLDANVNMIESSIKSGPLNNACAPLVLSVQNTLLMLGVKVGSKGAL